MIMDKKSQLLEKYDFWNVAPFDLLTDHYEKYVVTLDEITLPSRNGIRHIQAWDIYNFI